MIKIKLLEFDNEIGNSLLKFKVSGDINYSHMNALRRIIYSSIKQRAFSFENYNFKKNTSIFHNEKLKKRISLIPILINDDIINNQKNIKDEKIENFNKNSIIEDTDEEDNLDDTEKKINPTSLKQLTMYLKYHNKKKEIINITTNDCLFYLGEKKIMSPFKEPILILKLAADDEIDFSAITDINIENNHTIYSAVVTNYYIIIPEEKNINYIYTLESRGQITEKNILLIAIENIIEMLDIFYKLLIKKESELINLIEGEFLIINNKNEIDDLHSLGILIVEQLQNHKKINSASYHLLHPLSDTIIFEFQLKSSTINKNDNIINIINENIINLKLLFKNFSKEINLQL